MRAIKEAGLVIPDDLSVISIDDIDTAQYLSPMLTTIHIPVEEMGQMTAKILIDRIEEGHKLPIKMNLPFYLANRESCAPTPKRRRARNMNIQCQEKRTKPCLLHLRIPKQLLSLTPRAPQLISLKDASGCEYIWQRDAKYWKNAPLSCFP